MLRLATGDKALGLLARTLGHNYTVVDAGASQLEFPDKDVVVGVDSIATWLGTSAAAAEGGVQEVDQQDANDRAQTQQWLTWSHKQQGSGDDLERFNKHLLDRTFILDTRKSFVDIVAWGRLHPHVAKWGETELLEYSAIARWFDLIQHDPKVVESRGEFGMNQVEFDLAKALEKIAIDVVAAPPQGEEGKQEQQKKKKEKEKKKESGRKPPPPKAEFKPVPSMIDLKIGHILKAIKHPDADSLYVSTVDLGEETTRTVVSGLVKYIPIEDMQNRRVVCVCNLKPATMRGIKSEAMVLAASPKTGDGGEKDIVELVEPPAEATVGERIYFKGYEGEPEPVLNPKKKIWETVQPGFTTNENLQVGWTDESGAFNPLSASTGICTVKSIIQGSVR